MLSGIDEALLSDHDEWLQREVFGAGLCVAVYGAVDSGKTTLFKAASKQPARDGVHLRYWDLAPVDQHLGSPKGFADAFAEVMGVESAGPLADLEDTDTFLEMALAGCPGDGPVLLVLDHWDLALDNPLERIHAVSLDLLDSVIVDRHEHLRPEQREFRLVVLTGFPNVEAMCAWGRKRDQAAEGLKALSKKLERRYDAVQIPFLSRDASRKILTANGFNKTDALSLSTAAGGWLGLLAAAVKEHEEGNTADAGITAAARELLNKATIPALKDKWPPYDDEGNAEWLSRIIRDFMEQPYADKKFAEFAIPFVIAPDRSVQPVDAIRGLMSSPAFLFVDLENVYLADTNFAPKIRSRIIRLVADRTNVPVQNIHIGTRNERRAKKALGDVYQPWHLHYSVLPERMKITKGESGEKDNSDDSVLIGVIAERAARFPFARIYVLSRDNDFWGALIPLLRRTNRVVQLTLEEGDNPFLRLDVSGWDLDNETYRIAKQEVQLEEDRHHGGVQ